MSEQLNTIILKLRASVLSRRVKQHGYHLPAEEAQLWVRSHDDKNAYHEALQQVQRPVSFWSRFWWNR
ncbi:MAG: hypothetical protein SFX19_01615 [Alphaproteobacteria bacterium]|nr:hypothetical protein [Alphaproteobacteria bacterium]